MTWVALTRSTTIYGPFASRRAAETWLRGSGYGGCVMPLRPARVTS